MLHSYQLDSRFSRFNLLAMLLEICSLESKPLDWQTSCYFTKLKLNFGMD
jgi:hypothetical protein